MRIGSSFLNKRESAEGLRIKILGYLFILLVLAVIIQLFNLQVLQGSAYAALAAGQHELYKKLFPERGSIYVLDKDGNKSSLFPLVSNQELDMLYAVPREIEDPKAAAELIFAIFGLPESIDRIAAEKELSKDLSAELDPKLRAEILKTRLDAWYEDQKNKEIEKWTTKFSNKESQYLAIKHKISDAQSEKVKASGIRGFYFKKEAWRYYSEQNMGGQILGFWGIKNDERKGIYGLEGSFDALLAGKSGLIQSEKDNRGNIIAIGNNKFQEKVDGSDLVLTIDRAIQYKVCQTLFFAVKNSKADGGVIVVMEPKTGAIIAMCSNPDYNPDKYNEVEDPNVYNNPAIYSAYEPGSIFKPLTLAYALDAGKITPETTYEDTGSVKIGPNTIRNFENKVYGRQSMTQVLENSINTGVIYAMRQITPKVFYKYIKDSGFGDVTGIELDKEMPGNINNLKSGAEIYAATGSFGQGLTATPLQMVNAIAMIANGGKLMKPYIVSQIISPEKKVTNIEPKIIRQVISSKAASMAGAMMVSVVENGHGKKAGVPGYRVAGKTGTAQVANTDGKYDANATIGSFIGYAPFNDPKFVMLVRIDRPRTASLGELVAAPVFGDIAKFILQYYNVPYDNPSDPRLTQTVKKVSYGQENP